MPPASGSTRPTTSRRYAAEGIGGLDDRPKPGRPPWTDDVAMVLAMLEPPTQRLGVTRRSGRLLAAELGLSNVKVARVWRGTGCSRSGSATLGHQLQLRHGDRSRHRHQITESL